VIGRRDYHEGNGACILRQDHRFGPAIDQAPSPDADGITARPQLSVTAEAPADGAAPSGTVTFLFTDIEGSTRLLERLGARYAEVLARQRELLRAAIAEWHGHEVDTQGDAFFVAFARAGDALRCAVAIQQALAATEWPDHAVVRVRMGLHTGEPIIGTTGYVGLSVHRAARIAAAGHGGQILLSGTTRDLVNADLPTGVALRDLGAHKLKDLRDETRICQLVADGLPADFPPLATMPAAEPPATAGEPPYRGLQAFAEADAALFFGRDDLVAALTAQVGAARFVAVVGASGSGKSSILRAGLLPALRADGWRIVRLTPTAHPLEELASAVQPDASPRRVAQLVDDLATEPRSLALALRPQAGRRRVSPPRTLVAVDQLEEVFTLCRDETARAAFLANLATAAGLVSAPTAGPASAPATTPPEPDRPSVVIALRADFYAHLAPYPALRDAVAASQLYVGAMGPAELEQAIRQPARAGGWDFAPGLVELLLADVGGEPGALPLLSHALLETWQRRRGVTMTLGSYTESGGVRRAIARTADRVYQGELSADERVIARDIFVRLTELGEGTADTRRRVHLSELVPSDPQAAQRVHSVLGRLADARLITLAGDAVEVAHEALIREWPTLREWLEADREVLRLHRHLTDAAADWATADEDEALLFRGTRLTQAADWADANPAAANELERRFLDASSELARREDEEREAARRREVEAARAIARAMRQRAILFAGGLLAVAMLAGVAALFAAAATAQRQAADEARQAALAAQVTAQSQRLGAEADGVVGRDAGLAALLALRGLRLTYTPRADAALQTARRSLGGSPVFQHAGPVYGLAIADDGTLVTGSGESVYLWDASSGQQIGTIATELGPAHAPGRQLSLSANGTVLLVQDHLGQARLYDVADRSPVIGCCPSLDSAGIRALSYDGTELLTQLGLDGRPQIQATADGSDLPSPQLPSAVAFTFSPTGDHLAALVGGGAGGEVIDLSGRAAPVHLDANVKRFDTAAFSNDGALLVTANGDGNAYEFNALTGELLAAFKGGHTAALFDAQLSHDNVHLVTASRDGTACLWAVAAPAAPIRCFAHGGPVYAAIFSPDDSHIFTASADGTVRCWPVRSSSNTTAAYRMPDAQAVESLDFSADGSRLAAVSAGHVEVFERAGQPSHSTALMDSADPFSAVAQSGPLRLALSPDGGSLLLTAGSDPSLWNVDTGETVPFQTAISSHDLYPAAASFSADGQRLLAPVGGRLSVLDAATDRTILSPAPPGFTALTATLSPDGRRIAAWVQGAYVVWDIDGDRLVGDVLNQSVNESQPIDLSFTPDGKELVTGDQDNVARLWDVASGDLVRQFAGHTGAIRTARISRDGSYLLTASADGTARLWNIASGELVRFFADDGGQPVTAAAITPDGQTVAIGSADGTIVQTPVSLTTLEQQVCRELGGRALSDQERAEYQIDDPGPACP
jgi:WD40 repeat protein/class 3 adenylate cyclase